MIVSKEMRKTPEEAVSLSNYTSYIPKSIFKYSKSMVYEIKKLNTNDEMAGYLCI